MEDPYDNPNYPGCDVFLSPMKTCQTFIHNIDCESQRIVNITKTALSLSASKTVDKEKLDRWKNTHATSLITSLYKKTATHNKVQVATLFTHKMANRIGPVGNFEALNDPPLTITGQPINLRRFLIEAILIRLARVV